MSDNVKAILIDPFSRKIEQVQVVGDYKAIYPFIQADMFECVSFDENSGDTCYVDEEGLMKDNQMFFMIEGYPTPLAGRALIIGSNDEGESVDCTCTSADIIKKVRFMTPVHVAMWSRTHPEY